MPYDEWVESVLILGDKGLTKEIFDVNSLTASLNFSHVMMGKRKSIESFF
jgi:hypothetical protein